MTLAERIRLAHCQSIKPHSSAHYYGVKVVVSVFVAAAVFAPEGINLPIALGANLIWLWIEP